MAAKKALKRSDDLVDIIDEDEFTELFTKTQKGYEEQRDRTDEIKDNWDLYHCQLNDKQFYNGTSKIAVPFVHDAIEARVTRFVNQVFPNNGRFIEVSTMEQDPPQHLQALIENYVRKNKMRTKIVPALIRNGDLEGNYWLYLSWRKSVRRVAFRKDITPQTAGMDNPAAEKVEDIGIEEVIDQLPDPEAISDPDVLILPQAGNSIEEVLDDGGSVTIIRRWSKAKIKKLIEEEEINKEAGENLIEAMNKQRSSKDVDMAKEQLDAAGIRERGKVAIAYETWKKFKVRGEWMLCRVYQVTESEVLSCRQNPFWNDRCPLFGGPVRKMAGALKSPAPVEQVSDLQILANDTINEGADTAHYSALPVVMTDPLKNPRTETMMLDLGAVWETSPNDTQIVTFPPLWKDCLDRAMAIKEQIFQTLGVNPSMIPQSTASTTKKRNQAELAMEAQVDILTTADVTTNIEDVILTPYVQRCVEYDHQFRDKPTTIRVYGEPGMKANMEDVDPIQLNERFEFRWFGVEAARDAAKMQQQIAWINVVRQLPPESMQGYRLNLIPVVVRGTENVFGPQLGAQVFEKIMLITVDPMQENEMLLEGFPVEVHPGDNDIEHIQAHMQLLQAGDPHGNVRIHIQLHMAALQAKAQQQQMPQQSKPGQQGPGARPGGQASQGRPAQQPPGAIHKDSMGGAGAVTTPRRAA